MKKVLLFYLVSLSGFCSLSQNQDELELLDAVIQKFQNEYQQLLDFRRPTNDYANELRNQLYDFSKKFEQGAVVFNDVENFGNGSIGEYVDFLKTAQLNYNLGFDISWKEVRFVPPSIEEGLRFWTAYVDAEKSFRSIEKVLLLEFVVRIYPDDNEWNYKVYQINQKGRDVPKGFFSKIALTIGLDVGQNFFETNSILNKNEGSLALGVSYIKGVSFAAESHTKSFDYYFGISFSKLSTTSSLVDYENTRRAVDIDNEEFNEITQIHNLFEQAELNLFAINIGIGRKLVKLGKNVIGTRLYLGYQLTGNSSTQKTSGLASVAGQYEGRGDVVLNNLQNYGFGDFQLSKSSMPGISLPITGSLIATMHSNSAKKISYRIGVGVQYIPVFSSNIKEFENKLLNEDNQNISLRNLSSSPEFLLFKISATAILKLYGT